MIGRHVLHSHCTGEDLKHYESWCMRYVYPWSEMPAPYKSYCGPERYTWGSNLDLHTGSVAYL